MRRSRTKQAGCAPKVRRRSHPSVISNFCWLIDRFIKLGVEEYIFALDVRERDRRLPGDEMEERRLQKSNGRLLSGRSIIEDQLFALIARRKRIV